MMFQMSMFIMIFDEVMYHTTNIVICRAMHFFAKTMLIWHEYQVKLSISVPH